MVTSTPVYRAKGGYRRPYRTSSLIRDVISDKQPTYLQEVASETRARVKAFPMYAGKREVRRHLPSRETVRIYIYMADRLGLIEYTGQTGIAHRGHGGPDAPDLAERLYFQLKPGEEHNPAWDDLWTYYDAVKSGIEPEERVIEPPRVITPIEYPKAPRRRRAKPTEAPAGEAVSVMGEIEAVMPQVRELVDLSASLPTTGSLVSTQLQELEAKLWELKAKAQAAGDAEALRRIDEALDIFPQTREAMLKRQWTHLADLIGEIMGVLGL